MALIEIRPALRPALVGGACIGLLIATGITARAGDEPGLGGLFQRLFSPAQPAEPVQAQEPAPESYAQRRAQRAEAPAPPRIRYAALPKTEPLEIRVSARQTPLDMKAGAIAAFLKDETLQPGDIVVVKGGARVFTGQPGKGHTLRDFEPPQRSSLLDRQTRTQLATMFRPAGSLPADRAQAFDARLRNVALPPVVSAVARLESAAVRVIYPATRGP